MAFIKIIFLLTTSINLAFSENSLIAIELNMPEVFTNLLGTRESPQSLRNSVSSGGVIDDDSLETEGNKHSVGKDGINTMQVAEDGQSNSGEYELIKITVGGINDLATIYQAIRSSLEQTVDTGYQLILPALFKIKNVMRRMEEIRPLVEMTPGTIKSEILTYPPNFLKARLTYLLNLKKQQENNH